MLLAKKNMRLFFSNYQTKSKVHSSFVRIFPALGAGCYGTWKHLYLREAITRRAFPLTWAKQGFLRKKVVELRQDWFGTPKWPLFHCLETPICRAMKKKLLNRSTKEAKKMKCYIQKTPKYTTVLRSVMRTVFSCFLNTTLSLKQSRLNFFNKSRVGGRG